MDAYLRLWLIVIGRLSLFKIWTWSTNQSNYHSSVSVIMRWMNVPILWRFLLTSKGWKTQIRFLWFLNVFVVPLFCEELLCQTVARGMNLSQLSQCFEQDQQFLAMCHISQSAMGCWVSYNHFDLL